MLLRLLLARPILQLLPVLTQMLHAEPMHPVDFLVHDFQRRVAMAHQRLPQQIDAMPHMALLYIHREIIILQSKAIECRVMVGPVATPKPVLLGLVSDCKLRS